MKKESLIQLIKFGLVGVSNNVIYYIVYAVSVGLGAHYQLANICGFVVSVLNSFYWNNKYVFKKEEGEERSIIRSLIKTFISYGFTELVVSAGLLFIWVDVVHISEYVAPIINLCITVPFNFLMNKFWAFRK